MPPVLSQISMSKYRSICFTWHIPEAPVALDYPAVVGNLKHRKYAVFQLEKAPITGKLHLQGFVLFDQPVTLASIQRVMHGVHVEKPIADVATNIKYCTKLETRVDGPWELGRRPSPSSGSVRASSGQGSRTDLAEFRDAIRNGATNAQLWLSYPALMARHRLMVADVRAAFGNRRDAPPEVHIHFGDAGSGKSKLAHDLAPDAYVKVPGVWWDHYSGESDIIMDDFYGIDSYPYDLFLQLTDRYKFMAQVKGGMVPVNPKRIFITSNRHPRDWYCADPKYTVRAFFRRVTKILYFKIGEDPVEYDIPGLIERLE